MVATTAFLNRGVAFWAAVDKKLFLCLFIATIRCLLTISKIEFT
jgi:hypothetical protein